jgi:hypothetical protein
LSWDRGCRGLRLSEWVGADIRWSTGASGWGCEVRCKYQKGEGTRQAVDLAHASRQPGACQPDFKKGV